MYIQSVICYSHLNPIVVLDQKGQKQPHKYLHGQFLETWLCLAHLTGPAEAKLDWSGLPTLVYMNSQMRALVRRIRLGRSGGVLPQENFLKLDALKRLPRPFLGLKTSLEVFASVLAW